MVKYRVIFEILPEECETFCHSKQVMHFTEAKDFFTVRTLTKAIEDYNIEWGVEP